MYLVIQLHLQSKYWENVIFAEAGGQQPLSTL